MRRHLSFLVVAVALATGCSDRQHLNPLDPANPGTGGRPSGFIALASDQIVTLGWVAPAGSSIRGYRLSRRAGSETEFTELAVLLVPSITGYRDVGLANGVDHVYRLQYVLDTGALSAFAQTIATPGPLRPWVSDFSRRQLVHLTADDRVAVVEPTSSLDSPSDLALDVTNGRVWITDTFGGRVIGYSTSSGTEIELVGLQEPQSVAVVSDTGDVWVCDAGLDQVMRFDPDDPFAPIAVRAGVVDPLSIARDGVDGSVWVCERGADRLRHLDAGAQPIAAAIVSSPSRVAVDSLTRSAWVTSFSGRQVVRVSNDAQPRDTLGGFSGPIGITVDSRRGRIWVADAAGNRVIVLDRLGNELFRVTGLLEAREIGLDLATGDAWVTLPGEGAVAHVSAAGVILAKVRGLSQPYDVVVERR